MIMDTRLTMLSTKDNPFNPFTDYKEWFAYDTALGHYTAAYLARIVVSSDEISEEDQKIAINNAIDEIIKYDPLDLYIKVYPPS